jgi:hypothetical protein
MKKLEVFVESAQTFLIFVIMCILGVALYFSTKDCMTPYVPEKQDFDYEYVLVGPSYAEREAERIRQEEQKKRMFYDIPLDVYQQIYVIDLCEQYNVDPLTAFAVMQAESQFDAGAISDDGHDFGIMQIRDSNHASLGKLLNINDFLSFEQNTKAGIYILGDYSAKYGDKYGEAGILMLYNLGPTKALRMLQNGIQETDYTSKVEQAKKDLKKSFTFE